MPKVCVFLFVLLTLVLVTFGPGFYELWRAVKAARRGDRRQARRLTGRSLVLLALAIWIWACLWAAFDSHGPDFAYPLRLRELYARAQMEMSEQSNPSWPPQWRDPEVVTGCSKRDGGLPFICLPVSDLAWTAKNRPEKWIAYSPLIRRRYWWAPWSNVAMRYVLCAGGGNPPVKPQDFDRLLKEMGD